MRTKDCGWWNVVYRKPSNLLITKWTMQRLRIRLLLWVSLSIEIILKGMTWHIVWNRETLNYIISIDFKLSTNREHAPNDPDRNVEQSCEGEGVWEFSGNEPLENFEIEAKKVAWLKPPSIPPFIVVLVRAKIYQINYYANNDLVFWCIFRSLLLSDKKSKKILDSCFNGIVKTVEPAILSTITLNINGIKYTVNNPDAHTSLNEFIRNQPGLKGKYWTFCSIT